MSDRLFVEPAELRLAAREVDAADRAMARAAGALAAAGSFARAGLDRDGRADDKISTFVRQWRSEHELIGQMLHACGSVLAEAAACYDEIEVSVADVCRGG